MMGPEFILNSSVPAIFKAMRESATRARRSSCEEEVLRHSVGLRVDVWPLGNEPAMRRLLGFGVDGIMTDRPDVLARVLRE